MATFTSVHPVTQSEVLTYVYAALDAGSPYGRMIARYWTRGGWLRVVRDVTPAPLAKATWYDLTLTFDGATWRLLRVNGDSHELHVTRHASEAVACLFAEIALTELAPLPAAEPPRRRSHKEPFERKRRVPRPPRLCSVKDCAGRYYAKGFCVTHYRSIKRDGLLECAPDRLCEYCETPTRAVTRGLCARHYGIIWRSGGRKAVSKHAR